MIINCNCITSKSITVKFAVCNAVRGDTETVCMLAHHWHIILGSVVTIHLDTIPMWTMWIIADKIFCKHFTSHRYCTSSERAIGIGDNYSNHQTGL